MSLDVAKPEYSQLYPVQIPDRTSGAVKKLSLNTTFPLRFARYDGTQAQYLVSTVLTVMAAKEQINQLVYSPSH